jgi:hypothetical protein
MLFSSAVIEAVMSVPAGSLVPMLSRIRSGAWGVVKDRACSAHRLA